MRKISSQDTEWVKDRERLCKTEAVENRHIHTHTLCLHHEWNRNDAPLGSISEPLHTMVASPTFKCGKNVKHQAYYGRETKAPPQKSRVGTPRMVLSLKVYTVILQHIDIMLYLRQFLLDGKI